MNSNIGTGLDSEGTLLHHTVCSRQIERVCFLLEKGVDLDKKKRWGMTSVDWLPPQCGA
jgi:hypothetical protein